MPKQSTANRKKKLLNDMRAFLTLPAQRGRPVRPTEVMVGLHISNKTYYRHLGNMLLAQEWLIINQDAPLDAVRNMTGMRDEALNKEDVQISITTKQGDEVFLTKEVEKKKTSGVAAPLSAPSKRPSKDAPPTATNVNFAVGVSETTKEIAVVKASEFDVIVHRIRDAYVFAEIGAIPNVTKIMREFGLLGPDNKPTGPVSEEDVRKVMMHEDWKQARSENMHRTLDIIPDEVKMVSMTRNIEAQRMLFEEMKVVARNNRQFYAKGSVKTLDGSATLDWTPDPMGLAGMAEVMRRMVDGGGNVNILVNNFGGDHPNKKGGAMSLISRAYLSKLSTMTMDEIKTEIDRFDTLAMALDKDRPKVTITDIEAQELKDVTPKEPAEKDE